MDVMPRQDENVSVNLPEDYDESLNGIGGWLVLVIIGRIIGIILSIKDASDCGRLLGLRSDFDAFLYTGIAINIIGIILSVIILIFIFNRNIVFRTLFVVQVSMIFLFEIFSSIYFQGLGYNVSSVVTPSIISLIIGGIIWILYLYKSKRIKNTYIYPKLY